MQYPISDFFDDIRPDNPPGMAIFVERARPEMRPATQLLQLPACLPILQWYLFRPFMKVDIHPKYVDSEIRCACGNVIKTRSTKPVIIVGICNVCHPFYTGQQKFVDTAGRVDKFQQRMAKTQAAQAAAAAPKKKKK
jgi:large subunit ribosomal protein L31